MSFQQKNTLKAPFPYFGGKSQIASTIWQLLGNPEHYLEPFAGSLAVLLARPGGLTLPLNFAETVNDKDCIIANVWRALKYNPDEVARYADDIVCHVDLMAKKKYINDKQPELKALMSGDPEYYDCRIAGYYIWAASCWIGSGLVCPTQRPHLSGNGMGINATKAGKLTDWFGALQKRLEKVRIVNGDWTQILGGDWQGKAWNSVGFYFDPPYSDKAGRTKDIYSEDSLDVAHDVREYCIEILKRHPDYRIVLSGYFDEHQELLENGYDFISWKSNGGYGNITQDKTKLSLGQINHKKEVLFYSKNCNCEKMF